MKQWFKIDRKVFVSLLADVIGVIPSRTPYPIIENVKLLTWRGKLTAIATDLDLYVKAFTKDVKVSTPTVALLPARKLAGILKELKVDEVALSIEEHRVVLSANGIETRIPISDADEYPRMFNMPGPTTLEHVQDNRAVLPELAKKIRKLNEKARAYRDRIIPTIRKVPYFREAMTPFAKTDGYDWRRDVHDALEGCHPDRPPVEAPFAVRRGLSFFCAIYKFRRMIVELRKALDKFAELRKEHKQLLVAYLSTVKRRRKTSPKKVKPQDKSVDIKAEKPPKETPVTPEEPIPSEEKQPDIPVDIPEDKPKPSADAEKEEDMTYDGKEIAMDGEVLALVGDIVVTRTSYKGKDKIDVRKVYENGDDKLHPTRQGIRLTPEQWAHIVNAIKSAITV